MDDKKAIEVYNLDKEMKGIARELKRRARIKIYFPKNLTWTEEEWNNEGITIIWK